MRWAVLNLLPLLLSPLVSAAVPREPESKTLSTETTLPEHNATTFNGEQVPPFTRLSGTTYQQDISQGYWLVKGFSPYCSHCLSFAPKWQTLYEFYYTSDPVPASTDPVDAKVSLNSFTRYYNFKFAELDCVAFGSACSDLNISTFPTVILLKDGKEVKKATGDRSIKETSDFIEETLETIRPGSRPVGGPTLPNQGDKEAPNPSAANDKDKVTNEPQTGQKPIADNGPSGLVQKPTKPSATPNPSGTSRPFDLATFQQDITRSQDHWFIKFFAPWCHHCQRMAPSWEAMAKEMQGKLNVGEVNCEVEKRLCHDAGVTSYPTIFYFQGGERIEYDGLRGLGDFIAFANKAVEASKGVKDVTLEEFEDIEDAEEVIFVYFYDHATTSEDFTALERLPLHLIGHARIVKTNDVAMVKRFGISTWPRLCVSRDGTSTFYDHLSPADMRDVPKITRWMQSVWLPLVPELTSANARSIMDGKLVVLGVLSRDRSDEFAMAKREIKNAAVEWMDKERQAVQLETDDLRNAKQLRIDEAEDRNDERAATAAKKIKISADDLPRKPVGFAWVDGVFWERWIRTTFGIDVRDGEKVVIMDQKNHRYWDITETGNPILASRTSILETLPLVTCSPPKLTPKATGNVVSAAFRRLGYLLVEHPVSSLLGTLLLAAVVFVGWRQFLGGRRRRGRAGYLSPGEKERFFGSSMPNGKVD